MHQRSTASHARHWLSGFLSLLLVSGCLPSPTKAPTGPKASGLQVAGKPVASPSAVPSQMPTGNNLVPTLPIEVKAPIISHNGGNVIQGTVMAPAKIISHNGGNIISHNGGNIVGNNGGSIISHNGGNIISHNGGNIIGNNGSGFKISQVPLAYATVRLKDAAGNPVKDDKGNELVTKTDENGNYKFPVDVKGRNLVVHAEVPGQKADLVALLPKEGVTAETSVSVDMASTLTLSYILELYVKGDLATFEKLPRDLEAKARVQTETAIVKGAIALPETLERESLVTTVSNVLRSDKEAKNTFEEIRRILIVAGIQNEGDGLKATDIPVATVDGTVSDSNGTLYVFSRSRHTVWRVSKDGVARTLVSQGQWGYADTDNDKVGDHFISGMAFDLDGSLLVADTNYHRVVRISKEGTVSTIAGIGEPGLGGDGGDAKKAALNRPTGIAVQSDGGILISDSLNNRVRRISLQGKMSTFAGNGGQSPTSENSDLASITLKQPQGLLVSSDGDLFIADHGNNRVIRVIDKAVQKLVGPKEFEGPLSLAHMNGQVFLLCSSYRSVFQISEGISLIDARQIASNSESFYYFSNTKILASHEGGLVLNDDEKLYLSENLASLTHIFGSNSSGHISVGQLVLAYGMAIKENNVYVSDMGQHKVFKVENDGSFTHVIGSGTNDGYLTESENALLMPIPFPAGLAVANDGGVLLSSIGTHPVIRKLSPTGGIRTVVGNGKASYTSVPSGNALEVSLAGPYDIVEMPDGRLILAESDDDRLLEVSVTGEIVPLFSDLNLKNPVSLALDTKGRLNYLELNGDRIVLFENGELKTRLDYSQLSPEISTDKKLTGLAFKDGFIYIASQDTILRLDESGKKVVIAGQKGHFLNGSTKDQGVFEIENIGLTSSGDLYILEHSQLKKIPADLLSSLI